MKTWNIEINIAHDEIGGCNETNDMAYELIVDLANDIKII